MITELIKKFPNLKDIDVSTGAARGYGRVVLTIKDETQIFIWFEPDRVSASIFEDGKCIWSTNVRRQA